MQLFRSSSFACAVIQLPGASGGSWNLPVAAFSHSVFPTTFFLPTPPRVSPSTAGCRNKGMATRGNNCSQNPEKPPTTNHSFNKRTKRPTPDSSRQNEGRGSNLVSSVRVSGVEVLLFTSATPTKKPDWVTPIGLSENKSLPPSPLLFQSHGPDNDA